MDPDLRQLQRAVRGDRGALDALLRPWWPHIRRWCRLQIRNPALADDAAQEAVARVVRFISKVDPAKPFAPWLRRVVANAATDQLRDQVKHASDELSDVGSPTSLDRHIDLQRAADRAIDAFRGLAPRQAELIRRVDLDGESPTDVARDLGLSPGAVRNQLHTARRAVRSVLMQDPDTPLLLREA